MPLERKLEELLRDKDSKLELYKTSKNLNNVNRKKEWRMSARRWLTDRRSRLS